MKRSSRLLNFFSLQCLNLFNNSFNSWWNSICLHTLETGSSVPLELASICLQRVRLLKGLPLTEVTFAFLVSSAVAGLAHEVPTEQVCFLEHGRVLKSSEYGTTFLE